MECESMFSLELVVEKLYVPDVVCRFPAVAFRLLDFPSLLINHLDAELADILRQKIKDDPYYDTLEQFKELKDEQGNFLIKRGKSCLFRILPEALRSHLSNTPLYVMVLDTFPKIPKLIGNATIALDVAISAIHRDMNRFGINVPCFHGDKGLFKIYNLMGKEIGYAILGYRLLSLGPGLIPHISNNVLIQPSVRSLSDANPKGDKNSDKIKEADGLTQITIEDKQMPIILSDSNAFKGSENKESLKSVCTQTDSVKVNPVPSKVKTYFRDELKLEASKDDVTSINHTCPPPLFYNRKAQQVARESQKLTKKYSQQELSLKDVYENDFLGEASFNETESVSHATEDFSDTEVYNKRDRDQEKSDQRKIKKTEEHSVPILTTIIHELMMLNIPEVLQTCLQSLQLSSLETKKFDKKVQQQTERNNLLSSAIRTSKTQNKERNVCQSKSHVNCAQQKIGVPKNKGWIRSQPAFRVKKSHLMFGLTNTHRLRLVKGNPNLLQKLESESKPFGFAQQEAKGHRYSSSLPEQHKNKILEETPKRLIPTDIKPKNSNKLRVRLKNVTKTQNSHQIQSNIDNWDERIESLAQQYSDEKKLKVNSSYPGSKENIILDGSGQSKREPKLIDVQIPTISNDNNNVLGDENAKENKADEMMKTYKVIKSRQSKDLTKISAKIKTVRKSSSYQKKFLSPSLLYTENTNIHEPFLQSQDEDVAEELFNSNEIPELMQLVSDNERSPEFIKCYSSDLAQTNHQGESVPITRLKRPVLNPPESEQSPIPSAHRPESEQTEGRVVINTPGSSLSSILSKPQPQHDKDFLYGESASSNVISDLDSYTSIVSEREYSEDFIPIDEEETSDMSMKLNIIPQSKLGFTIA